MPFGNASTMKNCTEDKQKFDSKSRSKKYLKSSFKTVKVTQGRLTSVEEAKIMLNSFCYKESHSAYFKSFTSNFDAMNNFGACPDLGKSTIIRDAYIFG